MPQQENFARMNSMQPPAVQQGQEQMPNIGNFSQNYIPQQQGAGGGGMSGPPLLGGMPMQNTQQIPHHPHVNQPPNLTNTQPFVSAAHAGGPPVMQGQVAPGMSQNAPSGMMISMQNAQVGSNMVGNMVGMQPSAQNMSAPMAVQKAAAGGVMPSGASVQTMATASATMSQMQQQPPHQQGVAHQQMQPQAQVQMNAQQQAPQHPPQQQPHVQQPQLAPSQPGAQQQVRYAMPPGAPGAPGAPAGSGVPLNPHQQTNMLSGSKPMLKPWHNAEEHRSTRDTMIRNIIALLQQRRPNATQDWHEKLPHMARRLESELYLQAESLTEYSDPSTLKTRLQQLALTMGGKQQAAKTGVPGVAGGMPMAAPSGPSDPSQAQQGQHNMQQMQQMQAQQQQAGRANTTMMQGQYGGMQPQQGAQPHMMQPGMQPMQPGMQQTMQQPGGMAPNQSYQQMQQPQQQQGNMAMAPNQMRPAQAPAQQYSNQMQGTAAIPGAPNLAPGMGGYYGGIEGQQQHGQHIQQPHTMNMGMNMGMVQGQNAPQPNMQPPGVQQPQQGQSQQPPQRQFINLSQLNPLMATAASADHAAARSSPSLGPQDPSKAAQMQTQPQGQQARGSTVTNRLQNGAMLPPAMGQGQGAPQGQIPNMQGQMQGQVPPGPNMFNRAAAAAAGQMPQQGQGAVPDANGQIQGQPINHTDEHRRQVLKQQQQRLLLLRHASKCPHDNGRCPVTPHCSSMKQLWKHIMSCKDQECKVPHCVSSRYVLSHYSKCKDQACPVCGPVREAIRRNYERSREVVVTAIRQNDPAMSQAGGGGVAANMGGRGQADPSKPAETVGNKRKNAAGDAGKDAKKPKLTKKQQKELEAQQRAAGLTPGMPGQVPAMGQMPGQPGAVPIAGVPGAGIATAAGPAGAAQPKPPRKNANSKKAEAEKAKAANAPANAAPQFSSTPNFTGVIATFSGTPSTVVSGKATAKGAAAGAAVAAPLPAAAGANAANASQQKLTISISAKTLASKGAVPGSAATNSTPSFSGVRAGDAPIPAAAGPVVPAQPVKPRKVYPLDPVSCALYNFTPEHTQGHFKTILEGMKMTAAKIREICMPIIDQVLGMPHAYSIFGFPVDTVALNLPDYHDVIKMPMDLGTVRKRLETNAYRDLQNFVFDVHLTFDNAMLYNPKSSEVHMLSKNLKKEFDSLYKHAIIAQESAIEIARTNENACLICGEISLKFEPPVYYCNGRCGGQRIRRNAFYYTALNNSYHWCSTCFSDLRADQPIRLPDDTLYKADLAKNKKKHSEESEEPWVQCDGGCNRWVHQICALFNGRRNFSDEVAYVCPTCLAAKRKNNPSNEPIINNVNFKMAASDLPQCALSQFLEKRISERLEKAYQETASKLNIGLDTVEKCPPLSLRLVSSYDKMHITRENMLERYKHKNYPAEFPCRTKCVVLFQNIDGQDVILFGMYVYEYGHKCPAPNQRRVYISYLDSVHYFRPKQYRTIVYHEIIIAYLEYVKARGFHTAHIWACPPLKGDDYILYCHPSDQKTPKDDKLRKWYQDLLVECKTRGIVTEITDLYTEYLADPSNDATVLPYFEGDYWVSEAEVIIKDLKAGHVPDTAADADEGEEEEGSNAGTNKSKRKTNKSKAKRSTRASRGSLGVTDAKRDPVMTKLASIIEPMKEAFFVARLYPKEYADRCAEMLKDEGGADPAVKNPEVESQRIKELQEDGLRSETPAGSAGISPRAFSSSTSLTIPSDASKEQGGSVASDVTASTATGGSEATASASVVVKEEAGAKPSGEAPSSSGATIASTKNGEDTTTPSAESVATKEQVATGSGSSDAAQSAPASTENSGTEMEVTASDPSANTSTGEGGVAKEDTAGEDAPMDVEAPKDEPKEPAKSVEEPEVVPSAPALSRTPSSSSSSSVPPLTLGLRSSRRNSEVPPDVTTTATARGDRDHDDGVASPKQQPAPTPRSTRRVTRGKGSKSDDPPSAVPVAAPLFQADDADGGDSSAAASAEETKTAGDKVDDAVAATNSKSEDDSSKSASAATEKSSPAAHSEPSAPAAEKDSIVVDSKDGENKDSKSGDSVSLEVASATATSSSTSIDMDVDSSGGEAKSAGDHQSGGGIETAESKEVVAVASESESSSKGVETVGASEKPSMTTAAVVAESKSESSTTPAASAMDVDMDSTDSAGKQQVETTSGAPGEKAEAKGESGDKPEGAGEGAKASAGEAGSSGEAVDLENLIPGTLKVEVIAGVVLKDDTEDVDDTQESEHFDTRQSFLNLCQGNHYQFDQLRRAKHTSMMVLYHMHNPDAPKFVPNCNLCHADILVGYRYHCEPCDIDVCHACITANGARAHIHPLRAMAIAGAPPKTLTAEQRRERQRAIELHLQLLMHAAQCISGKDCKSKNCLKMKEFLKHEQTCKIGAKKGCPICKRISNLLTLHARGCRSDGCKVPKCTELREHIRQLTVRQQQMDDRRRAMMNDMYSRPGSNGNGVGAPSSKSGKGSDDEG